MWVGRVCFDSFVILLLVQKEQSQIMGISSLSNPMDMSAISFIKNDSHVECVNWAADIIR